MRLAVRSVRARGGSDQGEAPEGTRAIGKFGSRARGLLASSYVQLRRGIKPVASWARRGAGRGKSLLARHRPSREAQPANEGASAESSETARSPSEPTTYWQDLKARTGAQLKQLYRSAKKDHQAQEEDTEEREETRRRENLGLFLLKWTLRRTRHEIWENKSVLLLLIPLLIYMPLVLFAAFPNQLAVVMSGSMEPELKVGDLVILGPADNVVVGDIIAFETPRGNPAFPDRLIHRVAEYDQQGARYTTKGDANEDSDPFAVGTESVLGVYKYRVPYGGYAILFFQSKYGKIWMIIVAMVFAYPTLASIGVRTRREVHRAFFTGLADNVNLEFSGPDKQRLGRVEEGVTETREAMTQFSQAIREYATHLQSHTSAVQGMSDGSQELVSAVHTQNEVLGRLKEVLDGSGGPQMERLPRVSPGPIPMKRPSEPEPRPVLVKSPSEPEPRRVLVKRPTKALKKAQRTSPPGHYRSSL